jgi:hypothetical protein
MFIIYSSVKKMLNDIMDKRVYRMYKQVLIESPHPIRKYILSVYTKIDSLKPSDCV